MPTFPFSDSSTICAPLRANPDTQHQRRILIEVSQDQAEKIATSHAAGTRYRCRGFEGTVLEVRFGGRRSTFKLATIRICQDNGQEPRSFTATFGIAIDDLRGWCAEHHGCSKDEIVLWFDD